VTVGGVVVSNATLHNEDYIAGRDANGAPIREGKDLRVGDTVRSTARATSSPRSPMSTSPSARNAAPYAFPTVCPECGSDAVREEGDSRCAAAPAG
jgi:DNA ligase (NAD+)